MNKRDATELKRRLKKEDATFTRLCGCYVNAEHQKVLTFNKRFLSLEDDQYFKYLEIAKKVLSGKTGDQQLTLEFPQAEEKAGGRQHSLMALRDSKLENKDMLASFYDSIINTYDYTGNYLILLFHDAYDVIRTSTDNQKLDESEEVYEYILCAICPVNLSKPALGYLTQENEIGPRERDWIVAAPDTGFIFPDFCERSADIHSVMFYTKNTKAPHGELMEQVLGCVRKMTSTEKKRIFESVVMESIGTADEKSKYLYMDMQEKLLERMEEKGEGSEEAEPLTEATIKDIAKEIRLTDAVADRLSENYSNAFDKDMPDVEQLCDNKVLAKLEEHHELRDLEQKVFQLNDNIESLINVAHETYMATPETDMENRARMDAQIKAYWKVKSMVEDVLS